MAKPTEAEVAEAAKVAAEAAEAEAEEAEENESEEEEFDKERAMATITKLRGIEKDHKALLAEQKTKADEEAEAQKSLEQKLEDSQGQVKQLLLDAAETAVKADFIAKASAKGIEDTGLAYLAAKEQGSLGTADPKTGEVGSHNFEALEKEFPALAGDADEGAYSKRTKHDAGVHTKRPKKGVGGGFNDAVRGTISDLG